MPKKKQKRVEPLKRWSIRKGDEVVVIAGEDKGSRGKVLEIDRERNRVLVEGVNRAKKHQKPTNKNPHGGIVERELSIAISNVMIWDATEQKPAKVGYKSLEDGSKVRVSRRSGETLEG